MAPPAESVRLTDLPEPVRAAAGALFGSALPAAERYAWLLSTEGVTRGLIGPREAPRIWDRHLLNCAAVAELVPERVAAIDVGSGAGLPGVVLALARPDLTVTLVEPMARRTTFLTEVVAELALGDRVQVQRCRAEEAVGRVPVAEVVTARALARLDRLAAWCLPLTTIGGRLLALKGATAEDEVTAHRSEVVALGGSDPVVRRCGVGLIDPPTVVVEIIHMRSSGQARRRGPR